MMIMMTTSIALVDDHHTTTGSVYLHILFKFLLCCRLFFFFERRLRSSLDEYGAVRVCVELMCFVFNPNTIKIMIAYKCIYIHMYAYVYARVCVCCIYIHISYCFLAQTRQPKLKESLLTEQTNILKHDKCINDIQLYIIGDSPLLKGQKCCLWTNPEVFLLTKFRCLVVWVRAPRQLHEWEH